MNRYSCTGAETVIFKISSFCCFGVDFFTDFCILVTLLGFCCGFVGVKSPSSERETVDDRGFLTGCEMSSLSLEIVPLLDDLVAGLMAFFLCTADAFLLLASSDSESST